MTFMSKDLVDDVVSFFEGEDEDEGSSIPIRSDILNAAQRVSERIWYRHAWPMKEASSSVTVTNGVGVLPSDFHSVGPNGFVYRTTNQPLSPRPLQEVAMLKSTVGSTGQAVVYAIGRTYNDSDTRKRQILLYPLESTTVYIHYERTAPVLVDYAIDPGGTDGLYEWPIEFYSVIYEGTVWQRMLSTGDSRQMIQKGNFLEVLKDQIASAMQGREHSHTIQPFVGRNL